jgi:hypothetical protein
MAPSTGFGEGQACFDPQQLSSEDSDDAGEEADEGSAGAHQGSAGADQGFPRAHQGFAGAEQGFAGADQGSARANQGFAGTCQGPVGANLAGGGGDEGSQDEGGEHQGEDDEGSQDDGDKDEGGPDQGGGATAKTATHYFVDVPNPKESTYEKDELHIQIDPALRAQLQTENEEDISHFLALPEIILAKKRKRQQPLLDFTQSRILTSQDYITAMEQILEQREATAAVARRKKTEKEATREHRKAAKEQMDMEKR